MTVLALDSGAIFILGGIAVLAFFALFGVALAYHVVRDARRRSNSVVFLLFAFFLGFVPPFLGPLVYLVVRPPRTLDEERTQQLEEQALLETENDEPMVRACPNCGRQLDLEFIICPYCRTQFARRCAGCDRQLRLGWPVCPYCATEVGTQPMARAGRPVTR